MRSCICQILLCFIASSAVFSQGHDYDFKKRGIIPSDVNQITDSLIIIPSSVLLISQKSGKAVPYSLEDNVILINGSEGDSIIYHYRTFNIDFRYQSSLFDSSVIDQYYNDPNIAFDYRQSDDGSGIFGRKNLVYDGSFGRGLSFGNNQSLVLNSNFNLQIAGEIGDDISLLAAISDNSIPIQPEGNTQQIQEFDKVFIQLSKNGHKLIAGDYEIQKPTGYFINYYKKLTGLVYENQSQWGANPDQILNSQVGVAVSRGKFSRNNLNIKEGNQGPYNLIGEQGENFIIILAGTERVFADDRLLKRGENNDYIVDYNLGQIRFTNNYLVTKDSRIIVEFEYIDRQYSRSLVAANTQLKTGRLSIYFNAYHQQDAKTPSSDFNIDSSAIDALTQAGDQINNSFSSGLQVADQSDIANRAIYTFIDTFYIFQGNRIDTSVLQQTTSLIEGNSFTARFTDLGPNNGNYVLLSSNVNGRIYQWVAPDSISALPQGRYEPVLKLIAPESQQLLSLGGSYKISEKLDIEAEVSYSRLDKNRLSDIGDSDNVGFAASNNIKYSQRLNQNLWNLEIHNFSEFKQKNYNIITPYRNAEFNRDWNLISNEQNELQNSLSIGIKKGQNKFEFKSSIFNQSNFSRGYKQDININYSNSDWELYSKSSYLKSDQPLNSIIFFRPNLTVTRKFESLNNTALTASYEEELNESILEKDSLDRQSFRFRVLGVQIKGPGFNKINTTIGASHRTDYLPSKESLLKSSHALNISALTSYTPKENISFNLNLKWRELTIDNTQLSNQIPQKTLLTRLDNRMRIFKGGLTHNASYEINTGQEPKLEFTFEERRPGEGNYIYEDLNEDGIRQFNEYILAGFTDTARYVKIQLLNNTFINTNNVKINQNIRINPSSWINQDNKFKEIISIFNWNSLLKISRKTERTDNGNNIEFNPYNINSSDTNLVNLNSILQHNLFINQGHPKFDIQLSQRKVINRQVLTTGFEERKQEEYSSRIRINIKRQVDILLNLKYVEDNSDSEFFSERDFSLTNYQASGEVNYIPNRKLRLKGMLSYSDKKNLPEFGGEEVKQGDFGSELTYRTKEIGSIRISVTYAKVDFQSTGNTSLEYVILQGLRDGDNYQWGVQYDRTIFQNMQLNLGYDGRKNGVGKIVHTGRVSVRASF